MSNARCYVCNSNIFDGKVYEDMFDKRYTAEGFEQRSLANILEMALGIQLREENVHSPFVCSICKVSLLNYETLGTQLLAARDEILQMHNATLQLQNEKYQQGDAYLSEGNSSGDNLIENCSNVPSPNNCDMYQMDQYLDDMDLIVEESESMEDCYATEQLQKEDDVTVIPVAKPRISSIKLSCSYCDKTFTRRRWLEDHERVHTGERPYKCDICKYSFAQRSNLRSHMLVTHKNQTSFKCCYCDCTFKRNRLLDNHVKSKHTLVRDFQCEHCDAAFSNQASLSKHTLCHTGEKKYSCHICGKKFSRIENRNVHHFVHSNRKPYACVVCDKGFMRKHQLQQHIITSQHPNPQIVRRKPEFSAANNDKFVKFSPKDDSE